MPRMEANLPFAAFKCSSKFRHHVPGPTQREAFRQLTLMLLLTYALRNADCHAENLALLYSRTDKKFSLKKCGVDAVSIVALAYEIYTNPSDDNGVLFPLKMTRNPFGILWHW